MALVVKAHQYHNLYNTKQWQRLRYYQLLSNPLCKYCSDAGLIVNAKIVDHIKPHKGDESLMFNADNLQSLCKHCHDKVKATIERKGYLIGSDASGMPADKTSHWYK